MSELRTLIAGIYADDQGGIYINMREFLDRHGMPDSRELREVLWAEFCDVFVGLELFELRE